MTKVGFIYQNPSLTGLNKSTQNYYSDFKMAVYVGTREYKFGRLRLSHMVSDNLTELHEMAEKLGVSQWFQNEGRWPHYDISKTNKRKAILLGAVLVNDRELIKLLTPTQHE